MFNCLRVSAIAISAPLILSACVSGSPCVEVSLSPEDLGNLKSLIHDLDPRDDCRRDQTCYAHLACPTPQPDDPAPVLIEVTLKDRQVTVMPVNAAQPAHFVFTTSDTPDDLTIPQVGISASGVITHEDFTDLPATVFSKAVADATNCAARLSTHGA